MLQEIITSDHFAELQAAEQIQPRGETLLAYHFARLMALLANLKRDPKQRMRPYTADDFLLTFQQEEKAYPTPDELAAKCRAINKMMGGTERPRGDNRNSGG